MYFWLKFIYSSVLYLYPLILSTSISISWKLLIPVFLFVAHVVTSETKMIEIKKTLLNDILR